MKKRNNWRNPFRLSEGGIIEFKPITPEDLIEFDKQTGRFHMPVIRIGEHTMQLTPKDYDAEATLMNARNKAAVDEAKKIFDLSESASTNDIEAYIKDHPPSALAIAFLSQIARAILINKNLSEGREQGAKENKEKAEKNKKHMLEINADLLKHPDTARWTTSERADYIVKRNIKMVNGKPYEKRTIEDIITGT